MCRLFAPGVSDQGLTILHAPLRAMVVEPIGLSESPSQQRASFFRPGNIVDRSETLSRIEEPRGFRTTLVRGRLEPGS